MIRSLPHPALALCLLLAACGGDAPAPRAEGSGSGSTGEQAPRELPRLYRGILTMGPDSRAFAPCGEPVAAWLEDLTGGELPDAYARLASIPNEPIYAELQGVMGEPPESGPGARYPWGFQATGVRQLSWSDAAPECPEVEYGVVARGGDPPWWIRIAVDGVEYRSPDRTGPLLLPPAAEALASGARSFRVTLEDGALVELEIREVSCLDDATGEVFPYSAVLRTERGEETGCAWGEG